MCYVKGFSISEKWSDWIGNSSPYCSYWAVNKQFEPSSLEHAYYPITALQMNGLRLSLKGKVCPKVWIQWHRFPRNATNFKLVAAKNHALRSLASGLDSDRETGKGWTPGHLYYVLGPWKQLKAQTYIYRALNPEHLLPRSAQILPKNSSGFENVIIIPAETPDSKEKTSRENTSCLMQHGLGSRVSWVYFLQDGRFKMYIKNHKNV